MKTIAEIRSEQQWFDIENEVSKVIAKKYPNTEDMLNKQLSIREVYNLLVGENKPVSWIRSYKTFLKYTTSEHVELFNPNVTGSNTGTRYFIKIVDVVDLIYHFRNNML